jgi:omega-6 fatty acid desaturase (delta-12 desaturase)
MSMVPSPAAPAGDAQSIYKAIAEYARPSVGKAVWQLTGTLVPLFALWTLMVITIQRGDSYLVTLALAVPTAALQVRSFMFFHDCCHGSFFASRNANRVLGYITGILNFTPFEQWRRAHAEHHATVGDLDRRGIGDIWTLTVEEYESKSRFKQFMYSAMRNPWVMLCIGPFFLFGFIYRFTPKGAKRSERMSVWITNLALLGMFALAWLTIGWKAYLMIQIPLLFLCGSSGIWLFYIQHQFEGVYWARHEEWNPLKAAMEGSSYYALPKVIQWFTGSIGLHHIHHAQPRIPNYNLQKCLEEVPAMQNATRLTMLKALVALRLKLWDEKAHKLVGFHR